MKVKNYYVSWIYVRPNGIQSYDNKRNTKTRCIIKQGDEILSVGETLCGKKDSFSKEVGRKKSLGRALKALYPDQKEKRTEFWTGYRNLGKYPRWKLNSKKIVKEIQNVMSKFK